MRRAYSGTIPAVITLFAITSASLPTMPIRLRSASSDERSAFTTQALAASPRLFNDKINSFAPNVARLKPSKRAGHFSWLGSSLQRFLGLSSRRPADIVFALRLAATLRGTPKRPVALPNDTETPRAAILKETMIRELPILLEKTGLPTPPTDSLWIIPSGHPSNLPLKALVCAGRGGRLIIHEQFFSWLDERLNSRENPSQFRELLAQVLADVWFQWMNRTAIDAKHLHRASRQHFRESSELADQMQSELLTGSVNHPAAIAARHLEELSSEISNAVDVPVETVLDTLKKHAFPQPLLEEAHRHRFHLRSSAFRALLNVPVSWATDPSSVIKGIAQGIHSTHTLNARGQLFLSEPISGINHEIFSNLDRMPIYESSRKAYRNVSLEWIYFPQSESWGPALVRPLPTPLGPPPSTTYLKLIVDSHGKARWSGVNLTRADLLAQYACLREQFFVAGIVPINGETITLASEKRDGNRHTGNYHLAGHGGTPFLAAYEYEGLPTDIRLAGEDAPRPLQVAFYRGGDQVRHYLESHVFIENPAGLGELYGHFWIRVSSFIGRTWASTLLAVGERRSAYRKREIHFEYVLPKSSVGKAVEVLMDSFGVPVAITLKNAGHALFLKRLEIVDAQGKPIATHHSLLGSVSAEAITEALREAKVLGGLVKITRLKAVINHDKVRFVSVGGIKIQIPSKYIAGHWAVSLDAEVTFAPLLPGHDPTPVKIRLGSYTSNNPLIYPDIQFRSDTTLSVVEESPGKFVAKSRDAAYDQRWPRSAGGSA
jgi:hypothetical protein